MQETVPESLAKERKKYMNSLGRLFIYLFTQESLDAKESFSIPLDDGTRHYLRNAKMSREMTKMKMQNERK